MNTEENKTAKVKLDFKDSKYATGRRKKSIAKVWLKKGSGIIHVNKKKMIDYFINPNLQIAVNRPLKLVNGENIYDVRASVTGGGLSGQAGAVILGIARALVMTDANYKTSLKKEEFIDFKDQFGDDLAQQDVFWEKR